MIIDLTSILMIVQILVIAIGGTAFLIRIEGKLNLVNEKQVSFQSDTNKRMDSFEKEMEKLVEVTVEQARQNERATSQDIRLTTLQAQFQDHMKYHEKNPSSPRSRGKG